MNSNKIITWNPKMTITHYYILKWFDVCLQTILDDENECDDYSVKEEHEVGFEILQYYVCL